VIGECGGGRSTGREGQGGSGGGGGQAGRTEWCGGYIGRRTAGAVGEAGPARLGAGVGHPVGGGSRVRGPSFATGLVRVRQVSCRGFWFHHGRDKDRPRATHTNLASRVARDGIFD
jgi:hypothetical protein